MQKTTVQKTAEVATLPIRERILEVSDNEALRELISTICRRCGFDLIQARCGDDALRLYRKRGPFAFVLCDLYWYDGIPEPPLGNTKAIRHGIQLALAIRKLAPEQKIVIHTAAMQVREDMPTELCDIPILEKPFRIKELESYLENL
jgi:CheY-like chemotaxis protein